MAFGIFFLRNIVGSPERARSLHLARSGGQSQRAIWFLLPGHGASHMINGHFARRRYETTSSPRLNISSMRCRQTKPRVGPTCLRNTKRKKVQKPQKQMKID